MTKEQPQDCFEFPLTKALEVYKKVDGKNTISKCNKLFLKETTYQHSVLELQLEQLFVDGQISFANKLQNANQNTQEEQKEEDGMSLETKKIMTKMSYFGSSATNVEHLLNNFRQLFTKVCFTDEDYKHPLNKDYFDQLPTIDKKNLIIEYTSVFFIENWL